MANDPQLACGGYLYSGHTSFILTTLLFLYRYTPKHIFIYSIFYKIWKWVIGAMSLIGIICVILAHEHYTVDVIVAYYFITRLFWTTHSVLDSHHNKGDCRKKYVSMAEMEYYSKFRKNATNNSRHNNNNSSLYSSSSDSISIQENTSHPPLRKYDSNKVTHNQLRNFWFIRFLTWSEENIIVTKNEGALPFEYEPPIRAMTIFYNDIREAIWEKRQNKIERSNGYEFV